jgi:class 3 adenylate cyclase
MFAKPKPERADTLFRSPELARHRRRAGIWSCARERTVMFTDIAGFTQLAEALPPTLVARLLRNHFRLLARCIEAEQGHIDKIMGDGLVALWDGSDTDENTCAPALRAAIGIRTAVQADNAQRERRGQPPIRLRVGVHAGPLIATPLGPAGRLGIALCGDTMNVAQRLEDAARGVASRQAIAIVASDAVVARAGPSFRFNELGELPVRGRREPVRSFEVAGLEASHELGDTRSATA